MTPTVGCKGNPKCGVVVTGAGEYTGAGRSSAPAVGAGAGAGDDDDGAGAGDEPRRPGSAGSDRHCCCRMKKFSKAKTVQFSKDMGTQLCFTS